MPAYDTFKLWYALSVGSNSFASSTLKMQNAVVSGRDVSLIYCLPSRFSKRATDTSEALALDPTSPDTGTGMSDVILRITELRETTPTPGTEVLGILLNMFYIKSSDDIFLKGRFGLETTDNPNLDVLPIANAGYKFVSFKQEPNQEKPALLTYEIMLKFVGDHTKLGTRS